MPGGGGEVDRREGREEKGRGREEKGGERTEGRGGGERRERDEGRAWKE